MRNSLFPAITSALIALGLPSPSAAQDTTDQQLGSVHFETSCNEVAQRRFDRAMRYQHSYWYAQSREIFEEALKADPSCAIAHWGIALGLWDNQHNPPPAPNNAPALAAIQKAQAIGAKTQRERDYIDAMALLYTDYDKTPYRTRLMAHVKAMEAVAAALSAGRRGADRLRHPAQRLGAARRQDLCPAAQGRGDPGADLTAAAASSRRHALSDPSLRLSAAGAEGARGRQSLRQGGAGRAACRSTCRRTSTRAWAIGRNRSPPTSDRWQRPAHTTKTPRRCTRATIWSTPICNLPRTTRRVRSSNEMISVQKVGPACQAPTSRWRRARRVMRSSVATGRARWRLQVRPNAGSRMSMAITHFARALGAARAGQPGAATADIAKLAELRDTLRKANDAYWSEIVDIQRQVAVAWVMYAEGKHDDALRAMSAAADAEDKTEKHVVTPGPLAPARELYGYMLLDRGMAREALAAFEVDADEGAEPLSRLRRRRAGRRAARRQGQGESQLREADCARRRQFCASERCRRGKT